MVQACALAMGILAAASPFAVPAGALGDVRVLRIVTTGDAYLIALSSSCPGEYATPVDPGSATRSSCYFVKTLLDYDGLTGASGFVGSHVNHAFRCEVVASATAVVGDPLPFPGNMAVSDSIMVGFVDAGDVMHTYGGRLQRPPIGAVTNRVQGALGLLDVATLAGVPAWYLDQVTIRGATPVVEGTVMAWEFIVWNQGGSDVTVECEF